MGPADLTLEDLDALDLDEAHRLPRAAREALLDRVLAAGRRIVTDKPARQVGLLIDGFEEDLGRLFKLSAARISCSGFIPVDARGEVPTTDPIGQFRLCFENVRAGVERLGSSLDRVVSLTVFLTDMGRWSEMSDVYRGFFRALPARAAIGAGALNRGYQIEVAGLVAYKLAR